MDWTLVRHKRGSTRRSRNTSCKPSAGAPQSTRPEISSKLITEDEVKLLLDKMQLAIVKVERSMFFPRLVRQLRDLEVVEKLSRSGGNWSGPPSAGRHSKRDGEHGMNEESNDEDLCALLSEYAESKVELVLYGVGSITNSEVSRCQLSLALLLKRKSPAIREVGVYDPIMSALDVSVMVNLGCRPLEDNDEGRRPLNGPTLFYMPHCDVELYESVLQTNLKSGTLSQLVILGNSFRKYHERWSVSPLPQGERPTCLLEVQKFTEEIPVVDDFSPSAFNDTSWHFFF